MGTTEWHPECYRGFPSGAVDKSPPANAGDMGLIPGVGRFHMRSNQDYVLQLVNLYP